MSPVVRTARVSGAQRKLAISLLTGGAIAIAFLTLTPTTPGPGIPFLCLKCGEHPIVDLLLNVLLFLPFGIGLGLLGVRIQYAVLLSFLGTCCVETLQYLVVTGRYASIRDILANSAGGLIGFLIGRYWRVLLQPSHAEAHVLASIATLVWIATQAFASWAMGISPPAGTLWAQFQPHHPRFPAIFSGRILRFSVGSVRIAESDRLADDVADTVRDELRAGKPFRLVLTDVGVTPALAPIAIISAGPIRDVTWWTQDGHGARFGIMVRAHLLKLKIPAVRIADIVPKTRTDTITLSGSYRAGWYDLTAANRNDVRHRELRASPSWIWAFVLPFRFYAFGSEVAFITALYLLAVWLVLGYWNARSVVVRNSTVPVARLALGIGLGLYVAPLLFGLPLVSWSELAASIVGAVVGWTIRALTLNRARQ